MAKDYVISIIGKQDYDGEIGEVDLKTTGSYMEKNGKKFISYKEFADDGKTPITSVLKVENNRVEMIHTGDRTKLILEKGERHSCEYDTGVGNLSVGVFTSDIISTLDEHGGNIQIFYTLDINSSLSSKNEISITVREAE